MDRLLVVGLLVPAALCAAVLVAAWRPWRAEAPPGAGRWAGALAFGAAFLVAGHAVGAYWSFPPHERWQWLMELAAAAALVGAAERLGWLGGALWPLRAALACATGFLLVGPHLPAFW